MSLLVCGITTYNKDCNYLQQIDKLSEVEQKMNSESDSCKYRKLYSEYKKEFKKKKNLEKYLEGFRFNDKKYKNSRGESKLSKDEKREIFEARKKILKNVKNFKKEKDKTDWNKKNSKKKKNKKNKKNSY